MRNKKKRKTGATYFENCKKIANFASAIRTHSSMDRIMDSGSIDWGSTPHGCTIFGLRKNLPKAPFRKKVIKKFRAAVTALIFYSMGYNAVEYTTISFKLLKSAHCRHTARCRCVGVCCLYLSLLQ